jgi:hypothetical protein
MTAPSRRDVSFYSPSSLRILSALIDTPDMAREEIASAAFVSVNTFDNYKYRMIEHGLIHISGYRHRRSGHPAPLFRDGPGDPAERPQKLDQLARSRNWKVRTGYLEAQKAKRRLAKAQKVGMLAYLAGVRV